MNEDPSKPPPPAGDEPLRRVLARGPGWQEDFGELVRQHQGWVRAYLRTRIRDWAAAEDLAQDVFVTAYRRIQSYRGEASFEAWLRGIALNHLRNFLRKHRECSMGGHEDLQGLIDREAGIFCADGGDARSLEALRACLGRVDGSARELLEMRYVRGRTVREISADSGRGYSALTMQLHRLREVLAECIRRKLAASET